MSGIVASTRDRLQHRLCFLLSCGCEAYLPETAMLMAKESPQEFLDAACERLQREHVCSATHSLPAEPKS